MFEELHDHDHRAIAQRMDLLHFREEAPGMVFFHPRGHIIFRELQEAARRHIERAGYREVRSPQLLRRPIWEASGHWEHFDAAMFQLKEGHADRDSALKPVSCPGHIQIVDKQLQSYRDLPVRLAEFGMVHRDERSGSLHGLFRLRQFVQDDGHVFCRRSNAVEEVHRFCESLRVFYEAFGLGEARPVLSLRPPGRLEDDGRWSRAEAILRQGAEAAGLAPQQADGEGAFYGPKLEWHIPDHAGRFWQAGTIQVDLFMPERFGLRYVDEEDSSRAPILLHRALFGCPERFMGLLLEHHAGRLPVWLAPEQAVVLPISDDQRRYAREVLRALEGRDIRANIDAGEESLGRRIAAAHQRSVPFMLVVGSREAEDASVALRRGDEQSAMPMARAVEKVERAARPPM